MTAIAPVAAAPMPSTALRSLNSLTAPPTAGANAGTAEGGGGFKLKLFGIDLVKVGVFAGMGALAAMHIPPLAFLGGPIGGAVAGAALALLL